MISITLILLNLFTENWFLIDYSQEQIIMTTW